jgi:hypothetical protein
VAYLVRPKVVQTGPREYVVAVYVLDTATAGGPEEICFLARVERTGTRARNGMRQLLAEAKEQLAARGGAEIVTQDGDTMAMLARIK